MENKNGQGIFYGVIGVATLIVAIIGATFAYFSAAGVNNNTTITGTTGSGGGLSLVVSKESTGSGALIPQLVAGLGSAMTASCVDGNGNTVCQVYKIEATNNGSSAVSTTATLNLSSNAVNMKWSTVTDATTPGTISAHGSGTAYDIDTSDSSIVINGGAKATYYVVVWLDETTNPQDTDDGNGKTFTGTVSFETAGGGQVTSTFTA